MSIEDEAFDYTDEQESTSTDRGDFYSRGQVEAAFIAGASRKVEAAPSDPRETGSTKYTHNMPEAAPSDTDLQAELSKVGLPETASLADLIQHHRANAGVAAALDALSQPVKVEVTDKRVERALDEWNRFPPNRPEAAMRAALGGGDQ